MLCSSDWTARPTQFGYRKDPFPYPPRGLETRIARTNVQGYVFASRDATLSLPTLHSRTVCNRTVSYSIAGTSPYPRRGCQDTYESIAPVDAFRRNAGSPAACRRFAGERGAALRADPPTLVVCVSLSTPEAYRLAWRLSRVFFEFSSRPEPASLRVSPPYGQSRLLRIPPPLSGKGSKRPAVAFRAVSPLGLARTSRVSSAEH